MAVIGDENAQLRSRLPLRNEWSSAMAQQRRRFKQSEPLEERLAKEALRLRRLANDAPPGIKREWMLRRARQCETGSHMSEWLRSPGLKSPT